MKLIRTCTAAPEQYDVINDGIQIGYLRLRHGHFTAQVHGPHGPVVYEANTIGDGIFDPNEREMHLRNALGAIVMYDISIFDKTYE